MSTNRVIILSLISLGTFLYTSFVGYGLYLTLKYGGQLPNMIFNIILLINLIVIGIGIFVAIRAVKKYNQSIQPIPELDKKPYDKYTTGKTDTKQKSSDKQDRKLEDDYVDEILEDVPLEDENNAQE